MLDLLSGSMQERAKECLAAAFCKSVRWRDWASLFEFSPRKTLQAASTAHNAGRDVNCILV